MPTETSVQRASSTMQGETRVSESTHEYMTLAQSLNPDQVRVLDQILAQLDRMPSGARIGFFSVRSNDRNALLDYVVRPVAARKVRTPEHRKVLGLRIDAAVLPEGMQPWHALLMNVIELLTESALPNERLALNELRNELSRVIRTTQREPANSAALATNFARRFMMAFPRLVLNTVSLSNSVLLIVIDQLELVDAPSAAQWLEATQYFCNVQGCATLIAANEKVLVERLNQAAPAEGVGVLQHWMTKRVEYAATPLVARPLNLHIPGAETPHSSAVRDKRSTQPTDVPAACAHILLEALQPDSNAIELARAQWRVAMHLVGRRVEEGLGGNIPATMIAKLLALRGVVPTLFDAARYDAQMLTIIEKSALGDTSNDMYAEWMSLVTRHPRLANLLATEPTFSGIDLRDLATALRITSSEEVLNATPEQAMALPVEVKPSRVPVLNMRTLRNTAHRAEGQLAQSAPALIAGLTAACVFIGDRIIKLMIQGAALPPGEAMLGGLILPELHAPGASVSSAAAVGAEFFGLALAVMILIFWGASRSDSGYATSLGLIIGGLVTNLFDRLAFGSVLNYVHLANLPVFNLAHLALLLGALLLAFTMLRGQRASESPPRTETTATNH